jgi:hypothetical protein
MSPSCQIYCSASKAVVARDRVHGVPGSGSVCQKTKLLELTRRGIIVVALLVHFLPRDNDRTPFPAALDAHRVGSVLRRVRQRRAAPGKSCRRAQWLEPPTANASAPQCTPPSGPASMADGASCDADAPNSRRTRAAGEGRLCDHAIQLRYRRGCHCFRRCCDGQGETSNGNQPDHSFSPVLRRGSFIALKLQR